MKTLVLYIYIYIIKVQKFEPSNSEFWQTHSPPVIREYKETYNTEPQDYYEV